MMSIHMPHRMYSVCRATDLDLDCCRPHMRTGQLPGNVGYAVSITQTTKGTILKITGGRGRSVGLMIKLELSEKMKLKLSYSRKYLKSIGVFETRTNYKLTKRYE